MTINTPLGEKVDIFLLDRDTSNSFISKKLDKVLGEFTIAFKKKKIYQLDNGKVILDYTLNHYMILIDSYTEAKKILNNDYHSIIILHKKEGDFFYYFSVYDRYFKENPPHGKEKIKGSFPRSYLNFKGEKRPYYAIKNTEGILFYFERVDNVYQGKWYSNIKGFEYFYFLE